MGLEIEATAQAELPAVMAGESDHDAVVGAPAGFGEVDGKVPLAAADFFAETTIGSHAAADDKGFGADARGGLASTIEEFGDDGVLKAGQHVEGGGVSGGVEGAVEAASLYPTQDGGLEAAEAEVAGVALELGRSETDGAGVTEGGEAVNHRAARVAEAEEFGHLVVSLASSVVAGFAFEAVMALAEAFEDMGVATTGDEGQRGVLDINAQEGSANVAFEVVNTDEGNTLGISKGLGIGKAHEQTADQAGTLGDGNGGEVFEAGLRLIQSFADDRDDGAHMFAAGQFGYDATVALVNFELGGYARRKDFRAIFDDRGGGFIARRFDAKNSQTFSLTCAPTY